ANSQLNSAVRAPPMCKKPVGDGANLVTTLIVDKLLGTQGWLRVYHKRPHGASGSATIGHRRARCPRRLALARLAIPRPMARGPTARGARALGAVAAGRDRNGDRALLRSAGGAAGLARRGPAAGRSARRIGLCLALERRR